MLFNLAHLTCRLSHPKPSKRSLDLILSSFLAPVMYVHIFVFCPTDFFWKRLFLRYVNMNIWIYTPPPIIASSYGPVWKLFYDTRTSHVRTSKWLENDRRKGAWKACHRRTCNKNAILAKKGRTYRPFSYNIINTRLHMQERNNVTCKMHKRTITSSFCLPLFAILCGNISRITVVKHICYMLYQQSEVFK